MSQLQPRQDDLLLPEDSEVIVMAVRSLKGGRMMLPKPRFRFIGVPERPWSTSAPLIASCIALLDAPDNSVVCISRCDRDGLMIPSPGRSHSVPNSPRPLAIDEGVCEILLDVIPPTIGVSRGDVMELSPWSRVVSPFVVEACRMRRRGLPAFTPMVIGGDRAETVAMALLGIAMSLKVGVVVTMPPDGDWGSDILSSVASAVSKDLEEIPVDGDAGYGCSMR